MGIFSSKPSRYKLQLKTKARIKTLKAEWKALSPSWLEFKTEIEHIKANIDHVASLIKANKVNPSRGNKEIKAWKKQLKYKERAYKKIGGKISAIRSELNSLKTYSDSEE